jgi:UDP-N-acetylglucosamine--N-acetylmuramyl-(pentapeptide) pyrophosphoryl-undecaprenol N-acetylglucosamine transferase
MGARVMVMAGGTGGHVFPALAVARELRQRGADVVWLGSRGGFEVRVVPDAGFRSEWISVRGLRGKGAGQWILAPFRILAGMWQALRILRRNSPAVVLGMGGFVAGPGGVMARLLRIPLVIHEQNAVPGLTNRWLARIANRVLEAFPGSFQSVAATVVGNPVRSEIVALPEPRERMAAHGETPRLLVLGGSQGARALNETVPRALALIDSKQRPQVWHQAGREKEEVTATDYAEAGVEAKVEPFISNMAAAYGWADLVICRAGALTISELAAAGVGSVLVPFPFATDDHQTRNATFLTESGAARLLPEAEMSAQSLAQLLKELVSDRGALLEMATAARRCAEDSAAARVADICEEAMGS